LTHIASTRFDQSLALTVSPAEGPGVVAACDTLAVRAALLSVESSSLPPQPASSAMATHAALIFMVALLARSPPPQSPRL
jgi:hypothetical protein